jgi:hypothetical protein
MGRYAFFNTGIEYKFAFGVQSSEDILEFGGYANIQPNKDIGNIKWNLLDITYILEVLETLAKELEVSLPNFKGYDLTVGGTYNLKNFLGNNLNFDYIISYCFLLGCLIYHQLLYTEELTAEFEL